MCAAESHTQEQILFLQNSSFLLKPVITISSGSIPSKHMSSKDLTMPQPHFKMLWSAFCVVDIMSSLVYSTFSHFCPKPCTALCKMLIQLSSWEDFVPTCLVKSRAVSCSNSAHHTLHFTFCFTSFSCKPEQSSCLLTLFQFSVDWWIEGSWLNSVFTVSCLTHPVYYESHQKQFAQGQLWLNWKLEKANIFFYMPFSVLAGASTDVAKIKSFSSSRKAKLTKVWVRY